MLLCAVLFWCWCLLSFMFLCFRCKTNPLWDNKGFIHLQRILGTTNLGFLFLYCKRRIFKKVTSDKKINQSSRSKALSRAHLNVYVQHMWYVYEVIKMFCNSVNLFTCSNVSECVCVRVCQTCDADSRLEVWGSWQGYGGNSEGIHLSWGLHRGRVLRRWSEVNLIIKVVLKLLH